MYKGKGIRITVNFPTETLKAMKVWDDIFQALKENRCQIRLLNPAKVSFIIEKNFFKCP
jgi:hypothetical protein